MHRRQGREGTAEEGKEFGRKEGGRMGLCCVGGKKGRDREGEGGRLEEEEGGREGTHIVSNY